MKEGKEAEVLSAVFCFCSQGTWGAYDLRNQTKCGVDVIKVKYDIMNN